MSMAPLLISMVCWPGRRSLRHSSTFTIHSSSSIAAIRRSSSAGDPHESSPSAGGDAVMKGSADPAFEHRTKLMRRPVAPMMITPGRRGVTRARGSLTSR
jgi:hypothetical protein